MNLHRDIMSYIHNRWICPSDRVVIRHPDYSKGHYHDADHKMLYILFQMLIDFVEIECGSICGPYRFETTTQKSYRVVQDLPLLNWLLPPPRNARRGLHHLRWAMNLADMPSQAQQARDVFALYKFWVHTRPGRVEPFSSKFTGEERIHKSADNTIVFSPEYSAYLKTEGKLEDKYDREDQKMLQLLIKIRQGLWT